MLDVYRKEIKYIIPVEKFTKLKSVLDALMEKDIHGTGGGYMVRSQYYDSLSDTDLQDNPDGVMEKRKIRVRIYSVDAQTAKLEYKCKSNTDGRKQSLTITREEALLMENHSYEWLLRREEPGIVSVYEDDAGAYKPKTIVEYKRMAYAYPVNDVRVTFDTELKGTLSPYGLFDRTPAYIPLMKRDIGVLEIKYNHFLPSPIKGVLEEVNSVAEASSKYSKARLLITE